MNKYLFTVELFDAAGPKEPPHLYLRIAHDDIRRQRTSQFELSVDRKALEDLREQIELVLRGLDKGILIRASKNGREPCFSHDFESTSQSTIRCKVCGEEC